MNSIFRIIAISVMVAPASTLASTWSCTHNDLTRTVSVEYSESGAAPCAVNYTKETEGLAMQTPWTAENDVTFCEEKAEGLVGKLESWGWACSKSEAASEPESTPEAAAETAAETTADPAQP